jgi:cyclophilin family peptidyl-prolyl cis-trans isomerase
VTPNESLTATVDTSCGRFDIQLDTSNSPKTANSFAYLAKQGFYDDTTFNRIVPHFVIQGGDPLENGMGGPGYTVVEPPPANASYRMGTVAMAKTAVAPSGQSGSQFFVVTAADAGLPPNYAILGKVSSGFDVVKKIGTLGDPASGDVGKPLATVLIRQISVSGG